MNDKKININSLNDATDKINLNLLNNLNYGQSFKLNEEYELYKYFNEDYYVVFNTLLDEEILTVQFDKENISYTYLY